jgi:pyruvate-formate lyase
MMIDKLARVAGESLGRLELIEIKSDSIEAKALRRRIIKDLEDILMDDDYIDKLYDEDMEREFNEREFK